jgi:hypothetical protein
LLIGRSGDKPYTLRPFDVDSLQQEFRQNLEKGDSSRLIALCRWAGKAGTTPHFSFRKKGSRPGFSWFSGEVFTARFGIKIQFERFLKMTDKKGAERCQHKRYELKERVFVAIRPQYDRIGWLTDISKGGASFEYPVHCRDADKGNWPL